MFAWRRSVVAVMTVGLIALAGLAGAQPQSQTPQSLWADFNHYVRIARPDLALAAGTALLNRIDDDQQLLDVVEANEQYRDWQTGTITRAARMDTLEDLAVDLSRRIQQARVDRSRDEQRILADIQALGRSRRERVNAVERLRAAGQFSAQHLLATLLDEDQTNLHPAVLTTMVSIGQPLVYPLSIALSGLEPVPQAQVSQVLGEIGYPLSLPYLKQVLDDPGTDPNTRRVVRASYTVIADANNVPATVSAADLYLLLGRNYYTAQTRGTEISGYDSANDVGILWTYSRTVGLVPLEIPTPIFGDVLAMRSTERALSLNADLDAALSLWLTANLRRENNLPAGMRDISYPTGAQPAGFYARTAGPVRLHDVLDQALNDRDATLALDAIAALAETAGTDALVNRQGTVQPLLRALNFPDRRVRYEAAFAFTNVRPKQAFPGSFRIVPVLSEALRQTDVRYAVVLADSSDRVNVLTALVRDEGYEPISGTSLSDVNDRIAAGPGVDLIVISQDVDTVDRVFQATRDTYKLSAVPVLAVARTEAELLQLNSRFQDEHRVTMGQPGGDASTFARLVEQAATSYVGEPMHAEEALAYATSALYLLHDLALTSGEVFNVSDAKPALLQALDDARDEVPPIAGAVLALIEDDECQRALATAALDATRTTDARIAQLRNLSTSAMRYGNRLTAQQSQGILELVQTSTGDLALGASQAHGALTLPTSSAVDMIRTMQR